MVTQGPQGRNDAAAELAKRLGGPKAITKDNEPKDAISQLEETIAKVENTRARDLLSQQAKNLKASLELEEKETRKKIERIESGKEGTDVRNEAAEKEITRANITANALLLLDKGVPASVIGQYLIQSENAHIPIGLGNVGGQPQGLTMQDIVQIFNLAKAEKGTNPELTAILTKLTDKVSELEARVNNPQTQPQKKTWIIHPDGTKEEVEAGEPVVLRAPQNNNTGATIDEIREKNRHDERMAEITNDKNYKEKVADTLAGLPEKIGAGLAGSLVDADKPAGGQPAPAASSSVQYIKCETENCGYNIPYAPSSTKIVCPKCRTIYERKPDEAKA